MFFFGIMIVKKGVFEMVVMEDFIKFDFRIGMVVKVEVFLEVKMLVIKMIIDFGEEIGMK